MSPEKTAARRILSLSGTWQIAEGGMDAPPSAFERTVPVPGLVDMAAPAFTDPGPKVPDREKVPQKDPRRDAFWYRRAFTFAGPLPAVATLKIAKAMFGSRAILNGAPLGDHPPSFTPAHFDARAALREGENELLIRVAADRDTVTPAIPSGFDFEKERYMPGIFDDVELILSGTPHIVSVQAAPDIAASRVRVQAQVRNSGADAAAELVFEVREANSGRVAGRAAAGVRLAAGAEATAEVFIPIADCRLWSPEDPFLYALTVAAAADCVETRFGMREFRFDPQSGRAMLNGKPYHLRGSNITLYRFFEDPDRGNLPWDEGWVRRLHRLMKDMHWNCLRYCIGFPPESWYRIADEEGVLIQDEFPIWFGGPGWCVWPPELKREQLALEFAEWMRERWNHPCVVIWDASNETISEELAPAIRQVRGLDLSGRPWDNGFVPPDAPGDSFEAHPYHFIDSNYKLRNLAKADPVPQGSAIHNDGKHAVIINEYGWLWLNRDGSPTTLTSQLYLNLLGPDATPAQRLELYARYLAAETEFWRVGRKAAGILHFTALGYSRPNGQTSDHWLDVVNMVWEPNFLRYVRDSFAPVGLCLKFWNDREPAGGRLQLAVAVINDLDTPWSGPVTLRLTHAGLPAGELRQPCAAAPYGVGEVAFETVLPSAPGACVLEAELRGPDGAPVRSVRHFACEEGREEGHGDAARSSPS